MTVLYKRDDVSERASEHARTHARTIAHTLCFLPVSIAAAVRRERWLALVCLHVAPLVGLFVSSTRRGQGGEQRTLLIS